VASVTWKDSAAPLREKNFRWYFASRSTNTIGNAMAPIALAFAVLEITDSATALGQVLAAHTIPEVVFLLWGGVIADRFPRTLVIQVSNVFSCLVQGALALLVITGAAELWMVIVLSAFHGLLSAMSFPAIQSVMPQLVPRDQLQPANALMSLVRGSLAILGPTVGALLVVTVGAGWALFVDALTWFAAAVLLLGVRLPPPAPKDATAPGMFADLRAGWDFFRRTTWLWVVVLAFGLLNAIHVGAIYTLGPAVAKDTIGEQGWGLVLSAESAGLLLTTLVLLRVPLQRPLLYGMLGITTLGLPMFLLGARPELAVLVVVFFVAGAGTEIFGMGWNLAMQENIEESMLSRAYSYDALGSWVAMPVGQVLYGPLGAAFGYEEVLVVSAIVYVAISLLTLMSRSVRDLPRRPTVGEPSGRPTA
jgi:MFS family permease